MTQSNAQTNPANQSGPMPGQAKPEGSTCTMTDAEKKAQADKAAQGSCSTSAKPEEGSCSTKS